ncbi:GNAT family N-acetyltransferase [Scatolibacter rhodanostii]|uniref:GNAT family N-acetyltransferase n=1 Tax=Scatolibacter rhodanostii TaxID=2014781 RepID=UPI000C073205|nr:GNAT family N-acetyltransferase [Scatolibacter rhodanostii]
MEILFTDGSDKRFADLCNELDDYLNLLAGEKNLREKYNQYNTLKNIYDVVLVLEDGKAVACGSFKEYAPGVAEIKRVFTKEPFRNRGYSKTILSALEKRALDKGYKKLILETGILLKDAHNLYLSFGFHIIENYPPYTDMLESICMEKNLPF